MNAMIAELDHVPLTRCIRVFRSRAARTSVLTTHALPRNSLTAQGASRHSRGFSRSTTKTYKRLSDALGFHVRKYYSR